MIVWDYLHSNFCGGLHKVHLFLKSAYRIQGHPTSFILVRCNFLLMAHSNLCPIFPRFRYIARFLLRNIPPTVFLPKFRGVPVGWDPTDGVSRSRYLIA